jgi:hypothetical protein
MFESTRRVNSWSLLFSLFSVTYHTAVRKVRKTHGNAMVAIGMSLLQSFMFLAAFYLMFTVIGARTMAIRGDFMLYLLTGIYMYLVHIQALQAVLASENSTSPMMQHAPMNTLVAILSSALSVLYVKTISLLVVLFTMHTLIQPIEIYDWSSAMMMYLLAWGSGCAIGSDPHGVEALGPRCRHDPATGLRPRQHDRIGQDVRRQHAPGLHACDVRLEPAVPHHRPDARLTSSSTMFRTIPTGSIRYTRRLA